jgi:pimeloyl-ACP methyl ester carboxylesterase
MRIYCLRFVSFLGFCHTVWAFAELHSSLTYRQQRSYLALQSFFGGSSSSTSVIEDLTFVSPDTTGIQEKACVDAAKKMKRISVPVSNDVSPSGSVGISYIHWPPSTKTKRYVPPLILLHGFDSSGLEYRRLGPQLASQGIDAYAVDILGWGFTQLSDVSSFSANSKVDALKSFVRTMFGSSTSFVVAGASLGGAAAIELAAASSSTCAGLILIDAQGFVDGVGPMASLPKPLAQLGVGVLKSVPLRNMANKMSYYNVDQFATEEAQVIGRLHCLRDGWRDAMVSFMETGGFSPSSKIAKITAPALVLWGRQDGILEGKEFANKVRRFHHQ